MFGNQDFTVDQGRAIALSQLDHYASMLTREQEINFRNAYARLVLTSPEPKSGFDVPRGGQIERLYFLAKGLTKQDHDEFLASLD